MKSETPLKSIRGFTLAEVIVVIIILGVLSGLAMPRLMTAIDRTKNQEATQILLSVYGAQKEFERENSGAYADDIADLDITFSSTLKNFTLTVMDGSSSCFGQSVLAQAVPGFSTAYRVIVLENGSIRCTDPSACSVPAVCTRMGF